jgi:hypothetical protein
MEIRYYLAGFKNRLCSDTLEIYFYSFSSILKSFLQFFNSFLQFFWISSTILFNSFEFLLQFFSFFQFFSILLNFFYNSSAILVNSFSFLLHVFSSFEFPLRFFQNFNSFQRLIFHVFYYSAQVLFILGEQFLALHLNSVHCFFPSAMAVSLYS